MKSTINDLDRTLPTFTHSLIILNREQHCSLVKKNSWALGLRGVLARLGKSSRFVVPKPTSAVRHITLCRHSR